MPDCHGISPVRLSLSYLLEREKGGILGMRNNVELASLSDATIVAAMARQALDDGALIDGAELTEREARALWTLDALGCGRTES